LIEAGAGPVAGQSTSAVGLRASVGVDFGIVEPAFAVAWAPGRDPGEPAHVRQQGGLLFHGFLAMLRVHTPQPHQLGVAVGFGSGQLEAAQEAGADDLGLRGRPGPYTTIEASYRYNSGPLTLGLAAGALFFTHVDEIGDLVTTTRAPAGIVPFFSATLLAGLRFPVF
jgi:hypothetical protein